MPAYLLAGPAGCCGFPFPAKQAFPAGFVQIEILMKSLIAIRLHENKFQIRVQQLLPRFFIQFFWIDTGQQIRGFMVQLEQLPVRIEVVENLLFDPDLFCQA